jgi:NTP pyrophosphatase (non-canonical NTP hydrolase)
MFDERDRQILQAAIARFGRDAQHDMAIEECGELVVALSHIRRDRIPVSKLADEIADVAIMLEQLQILYGCHELVTDKVQHKLARLAERVESPPKADAR